ncbi:MAG: hypothetical protein IT382_11005 [Deltaproteobacteria bacterium]|nr:hypothetical protein [Deltaproteobacteria bacterium]
MRLGILLVVAAGTALGCADETLVELPDPPPAPEREEPADEPAPEPEDDPPPPPVTSGDECTTDSDCGQNAECESGTCVGVGLLQVTLTFEVDADYDLHVITPSGEEIYFGNTDASGGTLDVDQCIVACGPGTHVENVFFNDGVENGLYQAWVENFDGRQGGAFRIEVSGAATTQLTGVLAAESSARSTDLLWAIDN